MIVAATGLELERRSECIDRRLGLLRERCDATASRSSHRFYEVEWSRDKQVEPPGRSPVVAERRPNGRRRSLDLRRRGLRSQ